MILYYPTNKIDQAFRDNTIKRSSRQEKKHTLSKTRIKSREYQKERVLNETEVLH